MKKAGFMNWGFMNWGFIIVSYVSLLAFGLADNIRGPLFLEILKTYELSDFAGSFIFAASSFMALVAALLSPVWSKYLHQYRVLQLGLLFMAMGFCGMGWAKSYPQMLIFVCSFGVSVGLLSISQNYLVTVGSTEKHRPRFLSGLHAMYGLASLTAPLIAAYFSELQWSWKDIFILVGLVSFLVLLASFFKSLRKEHKEKSLVNLDPGPLSKTKVFMLAAAFSLYVVSEILVSSRLSLYLRRDFNYDLPQASRALFVFFVFLLLGRLMSSFINWGKSLRQALLWSLLSTTIILSLGLSINPWFLVLSGISMAPFYPLAISFMSEIFPGHVQAVIGWSMSLQSLFVVSMHVGVGQFSDSFGLAAALWLGPLACLVGYLFILLGVKPKHVPA